MTQNEKDLLLKDLCARLPYRVKVQYLSYQNPLEILSINPNGVTWVTGDKGYPFEVDWKDCKPYLFPLSSMTEEQKKEYNFWKHEVPVCHYAYGDVVEEIELYESPASFDYLIENHFDYYGLIPMKLAIDATGLNIY